jgi:hypothetical protein
MIPRKTVDDDLVLTRVTTEKLAIWSQPKGYMGIAIFEDWFTNTFLVELQHRGAFHGYGGPAILLLENCPVHTGPVFQALCETHRVSLCFYPPHSSNQLQALDLSMLGIVKRLLARANRIDAGNIQTKHIVNVVGAFMSAVIPWNIVRVSGYSGSVS